MVGIESVRRARSRWLASRIVPVLFAFAGSLPATSGLVHAAARIDPARFDCTALIHGGQAQQSWQQMVRLEHCDRVKRLARLARLAPEGVSPQFFVETIPHARLPPGIAVDVPLLRVVFPQRVFFDTASSRLRPEAIEVVQIVAQSLRQDVPDVALFVAGHTDPRGARDYNHNLSIDRANAVAERILNEGVNLATVWRIGFGADMPLVPNTGPQAWGYNRRVEFLFAGTPDAIAIWLADMQVDGLCKGTSLEEAADCKRNLDLRSDYEAVEVTSGPNMAALPRQAKATTNPTTKGISIAPVSGRTIVINPVNRTVRDSMQAEKNG